MEYNSRGDFFNFLYFTSVFNHNLYIHLPIVSFVVCYKLCIIYLKKNISRLQYLEKCRRTHNKLQRTLSRLQKKIFKSFLFRCLGMYAKKIKK